MKQQNIAMDLNIDGLNESLQVQGSASTGISLYIGNENDNNIPSVFLEDISRLQSRELIDKLAEVNVLLQRAVGELKELAIETYYNDFLASGSVEGIEE